MQCVKNCQITLPRHAVAASNSVALQLGDQCTGDCLSHALLVLSGDRSSVAQFIQELPDVSASTALIGGRTMRAKTFVVASSSPPCSSSMAVGMVTTVSSGLDIRFSFGWLSVLRFSTSCI